MPLYDFGCEDCGYTVEILTKSAGSSEIVLTCPECEKETMIRKVSLSTFHLKGQGWEKDGYTKQSIMDARAGYTKKSIRLDSPQPKNNDKEQ